MERRRCSRSGGSWRSSPLPKQHGRLCVEIRQPTETGIDIIRNERARIK
jgi:hypothetical protein